MKKYKNKRIFSEKKSEYSPRAKIFGNISTIFFSFAVILSLFLLSFPNLFNLNINVTTIGGDQVENQKYIQSEQASMLLDKKPSSSSIAQKSWEKQYGSTDILSSISVIDHENNIIALLQKYSGTDNVGIEILKISAKDGSILWQKSYSDSGNDSVSFVLVDENNSIFILGESAYDRSNDHLFLLGYTSSGSSIFYTKTITYYDSYNITAANFMFDYDQNLVVVSTLQTDTYGFEPTGIYALIISPESGNTIASSAKTPKSYEQYSYKKSMMLANNKILIISQKGTDISLISFSETASFSKTIEGVYRDAATFGKWIFLSYNSERVYYSHTYLILKLRALRIYDLATQTDIFSTNSYEYTNYTYASIDLSVHGDILLSYEYNYLNENNNSAGLVIFKKTDVMYDAQWEKVHDLEYINSTGYTYTISQSAMDFNGTAAVLFDEYNTLFSTRTFIVHLYDIKTASSYTYTLADNVPFDTNCLNFHFQPSGKLFVQFSEISLSANMSSSWYLLRNKLGSYSTPVYSSVSIGGGMESYRSYSTTATNDYVILFGEKGQPSLNSDAFIQIYDNKGNLLFNDVIKATPDTNESWWQIFIRNNSIYVSGYGAPTFGLEHNLLLSKYALNKTLSLTQIFDFSKTYKKPIRQILIFNDDDVKYYRDVFSGQGTREDPYTLKDVYINGFSEDCGIHIGQTNNIYYLIDNCEIANVKGSSQAAIHIKEIPNYLIAIKNCTLVGDTYGLWIENLNNDQQTGTLMIINNSIESEGGDGIYIENSQYINITNNYIHDNPSDGLVLVNSIYIIVNYNDIVDNVGYGVHLRGDSHDNKIFGNDLCNNGLGAYSSDGNKDNEVYDNKCLSKGIPGYSIALIGLVSLITLVIILNKITPKKYLFKFNSDKAHQKA
ncbi:MAG: right-handed parallel beta-helix repeat-containing protein [Promethearchaeota archaeon]